MVAGAAAASRSVKATFRSERRQTRQERPAERVPEQVTLEKDPVTGVYRPPKG